MSILINKKKKEPSSNLKVADNTITNFSDENQNQTSQNEKRYFDLLPDENEKDNTSFFALAEALDNPRIHNIAITGSYGAGKSTIIKSFIKSNHLEKKCIEISLASFACKKNETQWDVFFNGENNELVYKDETCEEDKSEIRINDIETSILQQIVYKKSASRLPNSKFSRIKHISDSVVNCWANTIIWFIVSIISFIKGEDIFSYIFPMVDFLNKPGLIVSCGIKYGAFIVIVLLSIKLFKKLFSQFTKVKNIKLHLKSTAEIELNTIRY